MNLCKIINTLLIIFFLLAITGPLIFVNKRAGRISTAENRVLANFPAIYTSDNKFNSQFNKHFENWFNDNLGFRDKLVKANTLFQYKLFGKLTRDNVMLGKNNWLYMMYPFMLKSYQNLDLPSEDRYLQYGRNFVLLNKYLSEEKIPFIAMVCPDKETIYPEYMPDSILKNGSQSKTDLIIDYLSKDIGIDIFTPKNALIREKGKVNVYSQNYDASHWNEYGAFIGYQELMEKVKQYIPEVKILTFEDFTITPTARAWKMYGAISFEEINPKFAYNREYSAISQRGILDDLNLKESHYAFRYVNNSNPTLPRALIIGDSFIHMFMLPNIAESFSEVIFIHWYNMDNVKGYIDIFKPDIFILEFMEPAVDQFTDSIKFSENYFDNYDKYKNLPNISPSNEIALWLDYYNNNQVQRQGKIIIDRFTKVVKLAGWAIDQQVGAPASNVFVQVGDKYYSGVYGIPRTSVSEYFKNNNLLNTGFVFNIDAEDLANAGKLNFIIISNDKRYQYTSIEYQIEVR